MCQQFHFKGGKRGRIYAPFRNIKILSIINVYILWYSVYVNCIFVMNNPDYHHKKAMKERTVPETITQKRQ